MQQKGSRNESEKPPSTPPPPPLLLQTGSSEKLLAGCAVELGLAVTPGVTQHPAQRGLTDPGMGMGLGEEGGSGRTGARWDAECISNPSVSVSSLSGDIITIAMAAPPGEPGRGGGSPGPPPPPPPPLLPPPLGWGMSALPKLPLFYTDFYFFCPWLYLNET